MSTARHSVSIHFAQTIIAAAKRRQVDHFALLHFSGLNEEMLANPKLRITPDQLSRIMQEMWRLCDDEFMGMASHPSRHGVFTLMAKQAVRCGNLHAVYHHLTHFYNLVTDSLKLSLNITDHEVHLCMKMTEPDRDPDCTLREFLLLLWHRFPSWLIGQRIHLKRVCLDYSEPAHKAEHQLMYPCVTLYNQPECSLVFSKELLQEAVVQTPRTLSAYLRRAPLDWFKRQAYFPTYTRRVIDYLERDEVLVMANMEAIAEELHITSRTLRRKLADEGTSFKELKDDVRRDSAIHFLSQPSIPISQISRKLGFTEPGAFTRAFKQWTGVPPSIYRRS
ncbi:AraC family transcriptional regulator [uncultured Neptuniibacter sp.]|uniref:AraC family transcriptional regulator n=1 Tax=uncultured Neptuniibacter sp. TaxID=502143 RepID=UPI00260F62C8|nr:AraC family transcriptional regulator [uncultured Neptuniibacter sp.]